MLYIYGKIFGYNNFFWGETGPRFQPLKITKIIANTVLTGVHFECMALALPIQI